MNKSFFSEEDLLVKNIRFINNIPGLLLSLDFEKRLTQLSGILYGKR